MSSRRSSAGHHPPHVHTGTPAARQTKDTKDTKGNEFTSCPLCAVVNLATASWKPAIRVGGATQREAGGHVGGDGDAGRAYLRAAAVTTIATAGCHEERRRIGWTKCAVEKRRKRPAKGERRGDAKEEAELRRARDPGGPPATRRRLRARPRAPCGCSTRCGAASLVRQDAVDADGGEDEGDGGEHRHQHEQRARALPRSASRDGSSSDRASDVGRFGSASRIASRTATTS